LLGVTGIDFSLDQLYEMMNSYKLGKSGFYMLTSTDGQLIYHPDKALKQKNISESNMSKVIIDAMKNKAAGSYTYAAMGKTNHGYVAPVGTTGWTVATGLPESEFNSTSNTVQTSVITIFLIALLIICVLLILISKSIVNPLVKLKNAANQIADGNLDVSIQVKSSDEVGQVSTALSRTVTRLKQYIEYIDEVSV
jgi:methyl-accepting chemotaxis protein